MAMILTSTLHDPKASLLDYIATATKRVSQNYGAWVVRVTPSTPESVVRRLQQHGVSVVWQDATNELTAENGGTNVVENDHLIALRAAAQVARTRDHRVIHYQDGDRVIMAATQYADDFNETAEHIDRFFDTDIAIARPTYVNLRRSGQDYLTHHAALLQTEINFNELYTEILGLRGTRGIIPVDIGSTSHAMTRNIVDQILQRSPELERVSFPHPKWLMIAKEMGARISSHGTYGVGAFETPLQYGDELRRSNDKDPVVVFTPNRKTRETDTHVITPHELGADYNLQTLVYLSHDGQTGLQGNLSIREWNSRFNNVTQYLQFLRDHLDVFAADKDKIPLYEQNITTALDSTQSQRELMQDLLLPDGQVGLAHDPREDIEDRINSYAEEFGQQDLGSRNAPENADVYPDEELMRSRRIGPEGA